MKTNKIKIFFSIISFCFLVISCNNLLSELTQQKTYIQISTNLGNTNQRTVLPDFSVVTENGYTWELYCDSKVLQTWNDDDEKSAYQNMCESKIEVDPGSYSFDLVIKKDIISNNNEIKSVTLLKGTISDYTISEGSNNLSFIMNPLPVTEGTGTINFTLNLPNDNTVTSANAELSLYGIEDKNFITENFESIENSSISVTFPASQINSGTYLLKIYLYNNGDVTSVVNVYYTIVVIYPGECSTETVTLTQLTKYCNVTTHYIDAKTNEEIESTSVYYKKDSVLPLPEVSRDDYSFGGYYNDPNFINPINTITINQDKDIYVKFIKDLAYVADVLEIYTERGLNTFRNIVNNLFSGIIKVGNTDFSSGNSSNQSLNAKLCSDIVLSDGSEWVPIGNSDHFYQGTFNGDGKCVKGLKITTNYSTDLGFFGCVQDATIMNLYVQGNITCDSSYNIGGIVGYAKSSEGNFVTISNCINNVEITNNYSSNSVGGILGWSSGAVDINSCVNIEEITNGYSVAGILGYGSSIVTIKNCLNLGKITMLSNSLDAVAGIANISGDLENRSSVTSCINASSIQGEEEADNIYPIANISSSPNATLSNNYYDSTILPTGTVTAVDEVFGKTSSDLDTLSLDGWYNGEVSDSQYPIPSTIQEAFENKSSCWDIILQAAEIAPEYVEGAYFVNGDTGNDTYDGSSRTSPKRNLTNVINLLKGQNVRTIYIDGELTAESQGVTETSSKKTLVTINDTDFGESNKITLIGINDATINAQKYGKFIDTNLNFYMKMQNLTIKNGWNNSSSGAALWFYGSSLELDECVIKDCVCTCLTDPQKYTGIYMSVSGSVLKMTNTTCENSIYLSLTEATIGSNCTIGTNNNEATDGFITLDSSTLILDGENIVINKPIYINNQNARIELRSNFEPTGIIQIKINSDLVNGFTLFETPRANLLDLFELVDSDGFILTEEGKIEK